MAYICLRFVPSYLPGSYWSLSLACLKSGPGQRILEFASHPFGSPILSFNKNWGAFSLGSKRKKIHLLVFFGQLVETSRESRDWNLRINRPRLGGWVGWLRFFFLTAQISGQPKMTFDKSGLTEMICQFTASSDCSAPGEEKWGYIKSIVDRRLYHPLVYEL